MCIMEAMDGRAYLQKLIADRLHPWRGSSVNRWEIRGVATGLVAAGVLSQADADRILADLDSRLGETGQSTTVTASSSRTVSFSTSARVARTPPIARQRQEDEHGQPTEMEPPELRRVISLAGRTADLGVVPAELLSLEVWSQFTVLNVACTGRRRPDVRWHGRDDLGGTYTGEIGGFAATWPLNVVRYLFKPAVPTEAASLTLVATSPDDDTEIPISLEDVKP